MRLIPALRKFLTPRRIHLACGWLLALRRHFKHTDKSERILLLCLDEIGDNLLRMALLNALHKANPRPVIDIVCRPLVANLYEGHPAINRIIDPPFPARANRDSVLLLRQLSGLLRFYGRTGFKHTYATAIVARSSDDYHWAHWLAYFSGAPIRLGCGKTYDLAGNEAESTVLINSRVRLPQPIHEAKIHALFLAALGYRLPLEPDLSLPTDATDTTEAARYLEASEQTANGWIGFVLSAGHPRRKWPRVCLQELGQRLIAEGWRIALLGGPPEQRDANRLQQALGERCVNTVGKLTLRQNAALLKRCAAVVGNDTGITHMAATVGCVVVAITCHPASGSDKHPLSPLRFGPYSDRATVLQPDEPLEPCVGACQADEAHCIRAVTVDSVYCALTKNLMPACT